MKTQQSLDIVTGPLREALAPGAVVLRGFAIRDEATLLAAIRNVVAEAPLRHMVTPGGFRMSVAMTNCGRFGWVADRAGYRYDPVDPDTGARWPQMPEVISALAARAAAQAGFDDFEPDACLINHYEPGARLSLHQDRDERGFHAPIVSVSLGIPAVFLFGGDSRSVKPRRIGLAHGDIVVWGGPSRMRFHGVAPLKEGMHSQVGRCRYNLTIRKAN
ncbi:MAG: DNA oxidative demethylase AlkB [Gammaproteobacteria bacterium]